MIVSCGFNHSKADLPYVLIVATCTDKQQNQGETDVDCGGPCAACPTCEDGIQNQEETGLDCGGPCPTTCPGMIS